MKRLILSVLVALMLLPSMAGATANYYTRPNGDTRFQDLSAAKRPIPSAEIDGEFNNIKSWLDGATYLWIPGTTPTYASTTTFTVVGDQTAIYVANRRIKANLSGTYVYCYVLSSSYSAPNTTVTVDSAVLTSALTGIYYGMYDVFMYGATDARNYGDGSYTAATINAAITALGTTNYRTLFIAPGTWTINAAITVPANITLKVVPGTTLTKSGSGTITFTGPLDARGRYPIFSGFASGNVTVNPARTPVVCPEWWGAVVDDNTGAVPTANFTAITNAINSGAQVVSFGGGTYYYDSGSGELTPVQYQTWQGRGRHDTVLDCVEATGSGIGFQGASFHYWCIRDMTVNSSGSSSGWGISIDVTTSGQNVYVEDCDITGFKSGIYYGAVQQSHILGAHVLGQGKGVAGGIGIQIGKASPARAATTTKIDAWLSAFATSIYNANCPGLRLDEAICEIADKALVADTLTVGELYVEAVDTASIETPVDGSLIAPYGVRIRPTNDFSAWPAVTHNGSAYLFSSIDTASYAQGYRQTSDQTVTGAGGFQTIVFNAVERQAASVLDAGSGIVTVNVPGRYKISAIVTITAATAADTYTIRINNTTSATVLAEQSVTAPANQSGFPLALTTTDYITKATGLSVTLDTSADRDVLQGRKYTQFIVEKIQ
jgi:hypothetical protein